MKNSIKLKGRMKSYLQSSLYLGFLLMAVNVLIYFIDYRAGVVLSIFIVLYISIILYMMFYNKPVIMNELVSFATQYGQIQRRLLRDLELPHALLDEAGKVIWTNIAFERLVHQEKGYRKSVTTLFPSITRDKLPGGEGEDEVEFDVEYENGNFIAKLKKISLREMAENSDIIEAKGYDGYLIALYLFDETALKIALREVDNQSLAVGLIYLDNYDEALESVEEVRRSLLIALIDRKVNKYIGMGYNGLSYSQNYEFARNAIDIALGRGGDQAVVKVPENVTYYGGKSQQMEKSTRVKARVKAHAFREIVAVKDEVYVMGHRMGDADSFGASVGIYRIARTLDKPAHIVLNDIGSSMQPMVDMFRDNNEYEEDMIINNAQALEMVGNNAVLVVVDVSKPSITECPELLKRCKSVVVLDHHRQGAEIIENATLSYIESYASSACEMVSEILQYTSDTLRLRPEEADCMYSGIMIDTNNFMTKTGVRTFEAAAFLRRNGADVTRVRKIFRDDAAEYKAKAYAVSHAEIYRTCYAISIFHGDNLASPTVIGAQAANELLNVKGIKASFILTPYNGMIYISARSIDEVNVQVIMERMGGGGHLNIAGAQIENGTLEEGIASIKRTLDAMIAEGELDG